MSTIRDVLDEKGADVAMIGPDATVQEAACMMNQRRIGALCVMDGGELVGVFTERDVLNRVVCERRDPSATKVGSVMTTPVTTCGPKGKTANCAAIMSQQHIRHLPVVEGGKLVGMISTGDLMAMQVADKQTHIENLYEYLHGRS